LRIAVITETYPPEINGVARTVARVVTGLIARDHTVDLIRPRQNSSEIARSDAQLTELLTVGIPIPRYPGLRFGLPSERVLCRRWQTARPSIVHIATEGPLGWSALRAAQRLGLPVVSEFRTNFHAYTQYYGIGWGAGLAKRYLRKFHNRTATTMVPTRSLAGELQLAGFERLEVVPRGVDVDVFHPGHRSTALRHKWGAAPESLVVLGVGRLAPEKNLELLKASYMAMRSVNSLVKLVVVGDGPARRSLQTSLPHAIFAGMRSGVELSEHYASADLLLFPSLTETYGNVTPEAMASGLPVLAYDYAAARELVQPGVSGWLAPFDDSIAFIDLATRAAHAADEVRKLGSHARAAVNQQSWGHVLGQIESHYRSAINRHSCPRAEPKKARGWKMRGEWFGLPAKN
jgi:glycosyltransferase involved in cell wall biosynthesis